MGKYDLVVIGAGPGGYPAAIRAAQMGASVILIEKEALGGTCLNWGCIPTKTLIAASSLYWKIGEGKQFGLHVEKAGVNYAELINYKNQVVNQLQTGVTRLLKANGVEVCRGTASFLSRNRIAVRQNDGHETKIEAGYTVIATGSVSARPSFLPQSETIVTSREFLELPALPQNLLVLGGGVIGCELACMAAQLGTNVTIVELLDDILTGIDSDLCAEVKLHMTDRLKIKILTGKPLSKIKAKGKGIQAEVDGATIQANLLLVTTGRGPATTGLALEKAGLKTNKHAFIEVDDYCQTRAATIYAVGDVNGIAQLAHAATAQGLLAAENIFGKSRSARTNIVPICIFTNPEIGTVGLSKQEAKSSTGGNVNVAKFHFAALGKAVASGDSSGFVKLITDADTGQILGAQAVGAHATELIAEATLAIQAELTAYELARTIHAHPTFSEAWAEAAQIACGHGLHSISHRKKDAGKN